MKKVLLTLSISLIGFISQAQMDSLDMKTGPLVLQARDAEYISYFLMSDDNFEQFFTDLKNKYKLANQPTGTTTITVDSVKVNTLISLSSFLRGSAHYGSKNVYTRIDAAIRATSNSFLVRQLNLMDKRDEDTFQHMRQKGKRGLQAGW